MENKMNEFSKRYNVEQLVITEEITGILQNFITTLTEENALLKQELEAANKGIENLNLQLLDMLNQNANKVKELKNWVSCKLEAIECNNSQLSEQLQIAEKTKSLKELSKPKRKTKTNLRLCSKGWSNISIRQHQKRIKQLFGHHKT